MAETNSTNQQERKGFLTSKPTQKSKGPGKLLSRTMPFRAHLLGEQDSWPNSRLQRTCSCGQHTLAGGECKSCRQRSITSSARSQEDESVGGERPGSITHSEFGQQHISHDFNWTTDNPGGLSLSHYRLRGGEGESEEDPEVIVGAERVRSTSNPLPQAVQRQDEAEEDGAVSLNYSTLTAPTNLGCGGFRSRVRWGLDGSSESANGFVVQKVTFDLQRERCAGGDSNLQTTYWEAWEVRNGDIFIGTSNSRHNADTFQVPAAPGHHGTNYEAGSAKFIPNYEAPRSWGNVPQARALPSTTEQPAEWSDSGTLHRWMMNTFDCCEQSDLGDFQSSG